MFSLTMLGSGSAGNSALIATDHCRLLVDGGLSARQLVLRLARCGISPNELDGVLLTHEHGDHVCGLEVLCRKFEIPIFCNALTAEAIRYGSLGTHRNWRIFRTGSTFTICDITVENFSVPHDAVEPVGYTFHAGATALGYITDLGHATRLTIERLRGADARHGLIHEKLLQNDSQRPGGKTAQPSRHGHLEHAAARRSLHSCCGRSRGWCSAISAGIVFARNSRPGRCVN